MKRIKLLPILILLVFGYSCKNAQVSPTPGRDNNLALGNPSGASTSDPNNYLIEKQQFTLSYNCTRGTANWASWHLSSDWKGAATRSNNFRPDNAIPDNCTPVTTNDYNGTGFDRGHIVPSDDRDASPEDNSATFLLTNIAPQAPDLNRQTWRELEEYARKLVKEGNELYQVAGVYGKGGSGTEGTRSTLAGGKVTVPARWWKIIVVLPEGNDDLKRTDASTRVIAVDMPNLQSVDNGKSWYDYRVSIDAIEAATGYDFLSGLSKSLQNSLESKVDNGLVQ